MPLVVAVVGVILGGCAASWPLVAQASVAQTWQDQADQVHDWLREETRRAAPAAPSAPAGEPTGTSPSSNPTLPPRVRALYGTHPNYTVWLEVDGRMRHYRPGASLPLNARTGSREFRLVKVVDRCVVLRPVSGGKVRTACYQTSTDHAPIRSQHLLDQPLPSLVSGN